MIVNRCADVTNFFTLPLVIIFVKTGASPAHIGAHILLNEAMTVPIGIDRASAVSISASTPYATLVELASALALNMAELADAKIAATELNKWYNDKGFNLAANGENVLDNLFGGETRIWAFDVPAGGYTIGTTSSEDKLTIPEGTYFFTDPVFNGNWGESDFAEDGDAYGHPE